MKTVLMRTAPLSTARPGPQRGRHRAGARLVPPATGKFSICTAKMNAATRPAIGAVLSSSLRRALTSEIPTHATAAALVAIDVGVEEAVGDVHQPPGQR